MKNDILKKNEETSRFFGGLLWKKTNPRAQAMMEMSFAMIIILMITFGVLRIFVWVGEDFANRKRAHDAKLIEKTYSPLQQVDPHFYTVKEMNAISPNLLGADPSMRRIWYGKVR